MRSGIDMQTSSERTQGETPPCVSLSEPMIVRIQTFYNIAKANSAPLSLRELLSLVPLDMTERELANAWQECSVLNDNYAITEGVIAEKNKQNRVNNAKMNEELERTKFNMQYANRFRAWMRNNDILTLAVSGSTSYQSASESDDLDFFLITNNGTMWATLTRSLILARFFRLIKRSAPTICLSFVADSDFAELHFATNQSSLIARDALSAKILFGDSYYTGLLRKNTWIQRYYPKLYERFFAFNYHVQTTKGRGVASALKRVLNLFLYGTIGGYIKLKSDLLNRKLTKQGRFSSLFEVRIGKDHCIFESTRYRKLKKMYTKLE